MIIARSVQSAARKARLAERGCVVTIGNFDGLHIGHQAMLSEAKAQADKRKLPLLVMSFDPHPEAFFLRAKEPARLSSMGERIVGLHKAGVDIACILPFNQKLADFSHIEFVDRILHKHLRTKCLVIGDDFRYGKGRIGNAQSLHAASQQFDFELIQLDSIRENNHRVSSSSIRRLLEAGNMQQAARYLGRSYAMMGRVNYGDARGRTWGFPTLNLPVRHKRALKGVFAVRVQGLVEKALEGVANLGTRPTVDGERTMLEVHLFNFQGNVYGHRICVEFCQQIRQEQKFDSFDTLKKQIAEDVEHAKTYFTDLENAA